MQSKNSDMIDPSRDKKSVCLAWATAVLLEAIAAVLAFYTVSGLHPWVWIVVIPCHLGAAGVVLSLGFSRTREMTRTRYRARLFGLLILFLPVLGLIGSLVLQLACDRLIKPHGLVEDFNEEADHRVLDPKSLYVRKDITAYFDEELSVQPVMDIMSGHDDDLKRGAINTLQRIGSPEAISILKKSLADVSPEIRHYAHIALTRLDEAYLAVIKDVQKKISAGTPGAGDYIKHAQLCIEYADSGLLDNDTRHYYLKMARAAYQNTLDAEVPDMAQLEVLGRLDLQMGDLDLADSHFQSILTKAPGNISALMGLAEIAYTKKDAAGLQDAVRRMQNAGNIDDGSTEDGIMFQFWTSLPKEA